MKKGEKKEKYLSSIFVLYTSKCSLECHWLKEVLDHLKGCEKLRRNEHSYYNHSLRLKLSVSFKFYTVTKKMIRSVDFNRKYV